MTAAVIYLSESDNIRIMVKWKATTSAFDVAEVTKRSSASPNSKSVPST
ncbi:MAG: hypothetical protein QGF78_02100 [Candidatus Bathyarchaeota archaeon]|jgi:hypothetical protein|nr:hypothetical protein [Candidatus Bathyarchaeota archaeon]